jgi:hypothetical protein
MPGGQTWYRSNFLPNGFGAREWLNSPMYAMPDQTQGVILVVIPLSEEEFLNLMVERDE